MLKLLYITGCIVSGLFMVVPDVNGQDTIPEKTYDIGDLVFTGRSKGTSFSRTTLNKVESISRAGLMKMACCNLSESFENSATVTVGFTDAVSGARQVQLLGLAGMYSQMLAENIPVMRGLASTYGWSYTPGPWLESIQISKGTSSVITGYESVTGQINLEFKKPDNTEQLFINAFADDAQRMEANITSSAKIAEKLWTGLLIHGSIEDKEHDMNKDGFMDMPRTKFVNLYNRWFYLDSDRGVESRTGIKFIYETRDGGQLSLSDAPERYITAIDNKGIALENKTGLSVGVKQGQSLGIITSFNRYEQNNSFGLKRYDGAQNSFYTNVLFTSYINNTNHQYTAGGSFMYDDYKTLYEDRLPFNNTALTDINRREYVPGAFAQYTYSLLDKFTFLAGMRADYNSKYGWLYTPRTNIRYQPADEVVLRVSAGKGYRAPNIIADNISVMGSSRKIDVGSIGGLDIEKAWNFGGNVSFYIPVWDERTLTLSLDYFHTYFENQVITDVERDIRNVYFYNLNESSYADAFQADLSLTLFEGLDFFAAFRYNKTKITIGDDNDSYKVEKPLVSRFRGLVNLSYATKFKKWVFDLTSQVNGPSRLPSLSGYSTEEDMSPAFPVWFAQVTKNTKRFDVYAGVENVFDFRQKNPILGAGNPFGTGFDSSRVWGPVMGRKIYAGVRLRVGKF